MKSKLPDDNGALMQNQSRVPTHSFAFINCTNKKREELHFQCSLERTRDLECHGGFDGDENMAKSTAKIMLALTNLTDELCRLFGVKKQFNDGL